MVSALNSALSGLNAADTRLSVAANNIANQNSTKSNDNGQTVDKPYTPQRVDVISLSSGGVQAQVKNVNPPTTTQPDPNQQGATTQVPNVDQANELIRATIAAYDYKANLKSIQVQQNLDKSLLDIKS